MAFLSMGLGGKNKRVVWKALHSHLRGGGQAGGRLADLNDGWVCKALVENVHVTSKL